LEQTGRFPPDQRRGSAQNMVALRYRSPARARDGEKSQGASLAVTRPRVGAKLIGHPAGNPATLERSGTVNVHIAGVPPKYSLDALIAMLVVGSVPPDGGSDALATSSIWDAYSGCEGISARQSWPEVVTVVMVAPFAGGPKTTVWLDGAS
jgi:hypothetical protein